MAGKLPATGEGFERFVEPELQARKLLHVANEHYEAHMGFRMGSRNTFPIEADSKPSGRGN